MPRKFYYYRIWIEDDEGSPVDIEDAVDMDDFEEGATDDPVQTKNSRKYYVRLDNLNGRKYHGIINRTKNDSEYFRRVGDSPPEPLSSHVDNDGETGDNAIDMVDFGLLTNTEEINVLMEVGYQTPGIRIITKFVECLVDEDDDYSVEYETRTERATKEKVEALKNKNLKSVEVSLKKNPDVYDDMDLWSSLKELTPDHYKLKYKISLEQGDGPIQKVEDWLVDKISNGEDDEVEDILSQIDLPKIMHSFKIEAFDDDRTDTEKENLADINDKEQVEDDRFSQNDGSLGQFLCDKLATRFG